MRFARIVFVVAGIWGIVVDAQAAVPDGLIGLLFVVAFAKTRALPGSR